MNVNQSSAPVSTETTEGAPLISEATEATDEGSNALENLELLVSSVADCAVIRVDPSGTVSSWHAVARHLYGYDDTEVIGRHVSMLYPDDDVTRGKCQIALAQALREGRSDKDEGVRIRKGGSEMWSSVTFAATATAHGTRLGTLVMVTCDLGQKRATELELRATQAEIDASRRHQRALAEMNLYALRNQHLQDLFDHAVASVATELGLGCVEIVEEVEPVAGAAARRAVVGRPDGRGSIFVVPISVHDKPYGVVRAHATGTRTFSAEEVDFVRAMAGVVGSAIARTRSEHQLRDAQERAESAQLLHAAAEEASRAKDEFLALLGHELRNPLAPIVTAIELLHLRGEDKGRELAIIERHVQHLTRLVDDLLDVSRVVRGQLELHPEPQEMVSVVRKGVEMASPLLEQRRQQFSLDVAGTGLAVLGDEARLVQVVSNLLTNAARYTPPGGRIWLSVVAEDTDFIVLTVGDNGIGIDAELLPHIFDVFTQGPRAPDRAEGGLGLGLALVKRIVALHGGSVSAKSGGPGRGSEFVLRLPRLASDLVSTPPAGSTRPLAAARSRRVLIVDDNADAAETLAAILGAVGHDVATAGDAIQALRAAAEHRPEVAILDIGLPVIDGYELAGRLRDLVGAEPLLLYAVTGYGQDGDRARALAAGFHRHFVKPVATEGLLSAIEKDGAPPAPDEP